MSDIQDLYQEMIVDHSRCPRNNGPMEDATATSEGYNPLCGDKVLLHVRLEDGVLQDIRFEGSGCAISTASASLLTEILKGKTVAEARKRFDEFHEMVTSDPTTEADFDGMGKLAALGGVREFPARIKCATLVWHTLQQAFEEQGIVSNTEGED